MTLNFNLRNISQFKPRILNTLPGFVALVSALWCISVLAVEFHGTPMGDFRGFLYVAAQFLFAATCITAFISITAASKWLFTIIFPPIWFAGWIMDYFILTTGTRLDGTTLEIVFANANADMTASLLSWQLITAVVAAAASAVALVWLRWRIHAPLRQALILASSGLAIFIVPYAFSPRLQAFLNNRLPYSLYHAAREYSINYREAATVRDTYGNVEASAQDDAPDVILVIGESLRADHLKANGYHRNTMPFMESDSNLFVFSRYYSPFFHTEASVPHILTRKVDGNPDAAYNDQSFITLFKNAGYRTAWFANQSLSSSYSYFAHEADTLLFPNGAANVYSYSRWLDRDIVPEFNKWRSLTQGKKLAVIHSIGSHWWYKSHYTDEDAKFKPEALGKDIAGISKEELINSYDNTIIATDAFLHCLVESVRDSNTVIVYVSDHGECLGEDGHFLHGSDWEQLHYPAMMIWVSDAYKSKYPDIIRNLKAHTDTPFDTEWIFHTVVGTARIATAPYNPRKSLTTSEISFTTTSVD